MDGLGKERVGQLGNRAEVKLIIGAGKTAKVGHQWVVRADVVVKSDDPAAVVEGRDCTEVCSDTFKVASPLVFWRFWIPIEGKGNHCLANATLPGVFRAGRGVARFRKSENEESKKV